MNFNAFSFILILGGGHASISTIDQNLSAPNRFAPRLALRSQKITIQDLQLETQGSWLSWAINLMVSKIYKYLTDFEILSLIFSL